jgi:hypothetical protein
MSNPKEEINLSIQDTLLLIVKMIQEGHTETPLKLAPLYLTQASELIDNLEADRDYLKARLAMHEPDREFYD